MKNSKFNIVSSVIGLSLALISSVAMGFAFAKGGFESSANYNSKVSAFEKTGYDYIVYSPIESQISEMKNEPSIKNVFEYYLYDSTVSFGEKNFETKSMFSMNNGGLSISPFNENRIKKGIYNLENNGVYIDDIVAKKLNVNVGESVNVSLGKGVNLDLIVSAVFETNSLYENGSIYFAYAGNIKETIDSKRTVALSGVLIQANNQQECFDYLKTYKPYGEMLPRDYFESDLEYEQYVVDFEQTDYSSRIFKKQAYLESLRQSNSDLLKEADTKIVIGSIVTSSIMLLTILIPIYAIKYESDNEKATKMPIANKKYRVAINAITIASYLLSCLMSVIFVLFLQNSINTYGSLPVTTIGTLAVSMAVSLAVVSLISNLIISKVNNRKISAIHGSNSNGK